jgi:membrane-associated phospholipid phosphatase
MICVAVGAAATPARADDAPDAAPAFDPHYVPRLIGLGVGFGLYLSSETFAKNTLSPDHCRWCTPPGFDRSVHDHLVWGNPKQADTLSGVTAFALTPLVALGTVLGSAFQHDERAKFFADDLLTVAEAGVYGQLVVQALKFSVARQRPYAFDHSGVYAPGTEDNVSFVSGHSALAFSLATAAGSVAQRRHLWYAPAVWAVGLGLATTTAYLRIAADKHYLSDVIAGGAIGAAAGLGLPRLLPGLPEGVTVVPSPGGLAVVGGF